MKLTCLILILIIYGCGEPYPAQKSIYEEGFADGFEKGVKAGRAYCGVDSITTTGMKWNNFIDGLTVDSITFKYDSIMVIHYNNSEVK